ncbi:MAG: TonB-dependent receptor [Candidatus Obscuribacterales bacterium]|nr:TonB-dependent receptor [Steroidobacteraceae bacterium]
MAKQFSARQSASLAAAISAILAAAPAAQAQQTNRVLDEVIVTATRRAESVQDVPLNIAAVTTEQIEAQGITNLADIGRRVPGLFVIDQGPRAANAIIMRGLNANPVNATEALGNGGGGTVATYIGEVPVYVDLRPVDLERIEVLIGPQGTLYGAGTLGGAIRYIPNRPQFDQTTVELRANGYMLSQSEGLGANAGMTLNLSKSEIFAFRASVDYLDDPGFIDYNFLVRVPGVSDPEPNFAIAGQRDANLAREKDADWQRTLSGRAALRWQVAEAVDANLTYYFQQQEVGGRTNSHQAAFNTHPYESAHRYLEPNERDNQLLALEVTADLGFAELTSATGYSRYDELGQRDQTDLLIAFEYSYEAFPAFSAFTREVQEDTTLNQELRLVSTSDGPFGWIAGVFYNNYESTSSTEEFTPGFSQYNIDIGLPGALRPDALEYIAVSKVDLVEKALYGELSFDITPQWQVTVGGRWYDYELDTKVDDDLPLLFTTIAPDGRGPNDVIIEFKDGGQSESGTLFKFNSRYKFTDDVMGYLTVSEGYRIGNSNGLGLCPGPSAAVPCASNREFQYFPDSTTNYELGMRTEWLNRRITFNASAFYIDWNDPQLLSSSFVGGAPITVNGSGVRSIGLDLVVDAKLTDHFSLAGSYGYARAELTDDAPDLIRTIDDPAQPGRFDPIGEDALAGDRLPGSPQHQGMVFATYEVTLPDGGDLKFNYGITAISDILTRTGMRGGGESLGGYSLHSASIVLSSEIWSLALYSKNLFNKYAATGARSSTRYVQGVTDENGDSVLLRSYYRDVLRPREIGLRINYKFSL